MKKYSKLIIILAILIVITLIVFLNGLTIATNNFIFTTRFFKTPEKAFYSENSSISIKNDLYLYVINEYNMLYFAETEDEQLLVAKMYTKKGKFVFTGDYVIYDLDDPIGVNSNSYNSDIIFNKKGKKDKVINWKLLICENVNNDENLELLFNYKKENNEYFFYIVLDN